MITEILDHLKKINNQWKLFGIFLLVNFIQATFTPLLNDEPYYWLYAQYPAWGYFDHPPLIGWLILIGYKFFQNELGVRFFSIIIGSLTFFLFYKIIKKEYEGKLNITILMLLLGSSVFLNLYSFLAIPDTLLLFFTILFLWQYGRFLKNDSIQNSIFLGVISVLLLYSKYHGILVIVFTVISNLKLFTKKSFYIVFVSTLLLFIPYIIWQFNNDFQTIRFHLIEKGNIFKIQNVLKFTGEQLAFTGPIIFLWFSINFHVTDQFQKTLKFITLGTFLFFFLSSFRGMVNAYWTLGAWPGMMILSYYFILNLKSKKKLVFSLLIFNLFLVILLRITFLFNLFPIRNFNDRNPKELISYLNEETEYPLLFENMIIEPSYYIFYQHKNCYAINNMGYKKSQFNYNTELEEIVQNKTVTIVSRDSINNTSRHIFINKGKNYYLSNVDQFITYQSGCVVKSAIANSMGINQRINFPVQINCQPQKKKLIEKNGAFLSFNMQNTKTKEYFKYDKKIHTPPVDEISFSIITPNIKGKYKCYFSVSQDTTLLNRTYNSDIFIITLK